MRLDVLPCQILASPRSLAHAITDPPAEGGARGALPLALLPLELQLARLLGILAVVWDADA